MRETNMTPKGAGLLQTMSTAILELWWAFRRACSPAQAAIRADDSYVAFISFRHVPRDRHYAVWLHGALETFVIPAALRADPRRRRLGRVFRDEEETAASPHLGRDIEAALEKSSWLVAVCSRDAPASLWMSAEIEYFQKLGRAERILTLLVDGEPATAFPAPLRSMREHAATDDPLKRNEPLAADARSRGWWAGRTRRVAKLKLIAAILGCSFDALEQRDRRRARRRKAWFAGAGLGTAIAAAIVLATLVRSGNQRASGVLSAAAVEAAEKGAPDRALKLAVLAARSSRLLPAAPDAARHLARAAHESMLLAYSARHSAEVWSVAFSSDGASVLTTSSDNTARIWVPASRTADVTLSGHDDVVVSARFSADGRRVVTASLDHTVRVWEAGSGRQLLKMTSAHPEVGKPRAHTPDGDPVRPTGAVAEAVFSGDGRRVTGGSNDGVVLVWDASSGSTVSTLSGHKESVAAVAITRDGKRVVSASSDSTGRIWDASSGRTVVTLTGHQGALVSVKYSPDEGRVVTTSHDGTARIWDATSGRLVKTLSGHQDLVRSAAFSPDGRYVVTASSDHTARIWEAESGRLVVTLRGHQDAVMSAAFSPDGRRAVTASSDRTVRIWDARDRGNTAGTVVITTPLFTFQGHEDGVVAAVFSGDGSRVASASRDRSVRIWDATLHRRVVFTGHQSEVVSAVFDPGGTSVATASLDRTARIWDVATGQPRLTLTHEAPVTAAAFGADGHSVMTASSDGAARVWETSSGRLVGTAAGPVGSAAAAMFTREHVRVVTRVITSSNDMSGVLWEMSIPSGRRDGTPVVLEPRIVTSLGRFYGSPSFTADGSRIASSSDGNVQIRNTRSGRIEGMFTKYEYGFPVVFNADGTRVATGAHAPGNTGHVLDAKTGRIVVAFESGSLRAAAFTPDGRHLATIPEAGGGLQVWNLEAGQVVTRFGGGYDRFISVTFSPDGRRLLTTSEDSTAEVWDVRWLGYTDANALIRDVCAEHLVAARRLNEGDLRASPLLQARSGEDVCDTLPLWRSIGGALGLR